MASRMVRDASLFNPDSGVFRRKRKAMAVKVKLEPNPLQPGQFKLRALRNVELTESELIRTIMSASSLTEAEIRGVDSRRREILVSALANNRPVVIPGLGRLSISLGGSFDQADAEVTRDQIDLRINLNVDDNLVDDVFQSLSLQSVVTPQAQPVITVALDAISGTLNAYAPNKVLRARGDHLFILDMTDPQQGVFLTPADGSGPPVKLVELVSNSSVELDALVPATMVGPQQLSVATRYTDAGSLRSTNYPTPLAQL